MTLLKKNITHDSEEFLTPSQMAIK